jgi:hypothetical protein
MAARRRFKYRSHIGFKSYHDIRESSSNVLIHHYADNGKIRLIAAKKLLSSEDEDELDD